MRWLERALWACAGAVIALIACVFWADYRSPVIELRKDEWRCTATEVRQVMMPMPVGKAIVMVPQSQEVCIRWEPA